MWSFNQTAIVIGLAIIALAAWLILMPDPVCDSFGYEKLDSEVDPPSRVYCRTEVVPVPSEWRALGATQQFCDQVMSVCALN